MLINNDEIKLYPSNWLYNAGVVGFLKVLAYNEEENNIDKIVANKINEEDLEKILFKGKIINEIPFWHYWYIQEGVLKQPIKLKLKKNKNKNENENKIFIKYELTYNDKKKYNYDSEEKLKHEIYDNGNDNNKEFLEFLYKYRKYVGTLFSKDCIYSNVYPPNKLWDLNYFITYFCKEKLFKKPKINEHNSNSIEKCSFCNSDKYELLPLDSKFMNMLMPSYGGFPNSFWNSKSNDIDKICTFCQFLLIHHHLAFTKLADGSEIFINAPSFKVMYELNKIVKEMFGKEATGNQKREILAMSVIEYARRVQTTLGQWAAMNIEIVMKSGNIIDFYILPYETIQLISDRKIAALLSDIGEFSILNAVLDGKEKELLDLAYHFVQISFKGEKNKGDQKFINDFLKRDKNKIRLNSTAQKILNLYATIKERRNVYA